MRLSKRLGYEYVHLTDADRLEQYSHIRDEEDRQALAERKAAQMLLLNAKPDGMKCSTKACPFPSLLQGRCRQHYLEQFQSISIVGCAAAEMIALGGMGVGGYRNRVNEGD